MVEVRVGDEWTLLAGRTYRIIEPWEGESCGALNPEGERVGLMLDDFADPDDPLELTWADPRVGDEWTNSSVSFRISAIHCTWSGEVRVDAEPLVGGFQYNRGMTVEAMRAVGWRPAPRSPKGTPIVNAVGRVIGTTVPRPAKPLTITTRDEAVAAFGKGSMFDAPIQKPPATIVIPVPANPAPQVGDVWRYRAWPDLDRRVVRIDSGEVFFDGIKAAPATVSGMMHGDGWRRVSAAPAKPAACGYARVATVNKADVAAHPERYRWRAHRGTMRESLGSLPFAVEACGAFWRARPGSDGNWQPGAWYSFETTSLTSDCDPLPLEDGEADAELRARCKDRWDAVRNADPAKQSWAVVPAEVRPVNVVAEVKCEPLPTGPSYEQVDAAIGTIVMGAEKGMRGVRLGDFVIPWTGKVPDEMVNRTKPKPKPPPTWRDLFHEVAANPPRYGRETWGKRAVKALWVRAAANALENVRRSYAKQVAGNGARQHVERDVDAEYRRLGGEVW